MKTNMEQYTLYIKDNKITIQKADYIEEGWYIEIEDYIVTLYQIPTGSGEDRVVGCYATVMEAIEMSKTLT